MSDSRQTRPGARIGALVVALTLPPWTVRSLLVAEKAAAVEAVDLRGYLSDLMVGVILAAACLVIVAWSRRSLVRIALAGFAAAWGFLNVANYEHVQVLDAPIEATYAAFLGDSTFVAGSALSVTHPLAAFLLMALPPALAWWGLAHVPADRSFRRGAVFAALGWSIVLVWPMPVSSATWRGRNFVMGLFTSAGPEADATASAGRVEPADLNGEPLFSLEPRRHNVLLVMLEGVSGAHLPSLADAYGFGRAGLMPELDRIAREGVSVPGFIAQQRQTNRGEYAVLCGDYPKLIGDTARMSEYVDHPGVPCLPAVLRDAGYATAYLQSAPLGFMLKDQFMPKAGFSDVRGAEFFLDGYAKNGWGIDDRAFFEQSLEVLRELDHGEQPWFATLLTVGTHHPYLVPGDFGGGGSPHERSLRYADAALARFVEGLEAAGLLDDTLVIFTSDESSGAERGANGFSRELSDNWGVFAAMVPGDLGRGLVQDQPFAQSDIALSVLDYLGQPALAAQFGGRSVFRRYAEPRAVWFANVYAHKIYELGADGFLLACDDALEQCIRYQLEAQHLMARRTEVGPATEQRMGPLREAVRASTAPRSRGDGSAGELTLDLLPNGATELAVTHAKNSHILFGGQHLALGAGRTARFELELEVTGEKAVVEVTHELAARDREVLVHPYIGALESGDRVLLAYEYTPSRARSQVEANVWARKLAGKQAGLVVRTARIVLRDGQPPSEDTTHYSIFEIRHRRAGHDLGMKRLAANDCTKIVAERAVGSDCTDKAVLFGPYVFAPRGSIVRARYEVVGGTGGGRFFVDVVSAKAAHVHANGETVRVAQGEHAIVEVERVMDKSVHDVETRLRFVPDHGRGSFTVESASVTVEFPPVDQRPRRTAGH